jgi:regulator of replication initiation timing
MFTKSKIKIMCIAAWLHRELTMAEIATITGKGDSIVENVEFVRINGILILNHWHKQGYTYRNIITLQQRIKKVKDYYNRIDKSIRKVISENKNLDIDNNWIPMYLTLAIAKKFRNEGIEIFPPCIDIEEMVKIFTSTDKITRRTKMIYWSIASQILEDMRGIK